MRGDPQGRFVKTSALEAARAASEAAQEAEAQAQGQAALGDADEEDEPFSSGDEAEA